MQRSILTILRQHTGESPETFQFRLMLLAVTASFLLLIYQTLCYANTGIKLKCT